MFCRSPTSGAPFFCRSKDASVNTPRSIRSRVFASTSSFNSNQAATVAIGRENRRIHMEHNLAFQVQSTSTLETDQASEGARSMQADKRSLRGASHYTREPVLPSLQREYNTMTICSIFDCRTIKKIENKNQKVWRKIYIFTFVYTMMYGSAGLFRG